MTEKQAKDLREQREGRRIDVEAGNDRYDIEFGQCLDVLIPCRTAQYLIVLWFEVNHNMKCRSLSFMAVRCILASLYTEVV